MLIIGGITASANVGHTSSGGTSMSHSHKSPSPIGVPAITPRIHGTPAFTTEDVRLYYQSHSFGAGPTVSGAAPSIDSIRFMTSREARVLLNGEFIGIPDNAMVCFVQLSGPFYPRLVSVPPGQSLPATVDKGFEVFDAQNGYRLLWGFR